MKSFLLLLFFALSMQAKFYEPLSQANIALKIDCENIQNTNITKLQKFCEKYILSVQSTHKIEQALEAKEKVSRQDSKAYLNALRKDAQFRKHIVHIIEEEILRSKNDALALQLFNLNSFQASIESVKNIQNRAISFPPQTQKKIDQFLYQYHLPKKSYTQRNTKYSPNTTPSLAPSTRINYTSISTDYSNPDTIREYPQNYLNKGFTLECTASSLYVKQDESIHNYKKISGFSCKNNNGATSFLWNVYATGKVLNRFSSISKKKMNFKAYARVKKFGDSFIIIIDKFEKSMRFVPHYLS